ncbi:vascular cell adhesion protein 1-like [Actinia tenebrosa]|uniref:Vascular cell adhesion protein 1-like n=1 Tax=Actinia tenebrosa TaxID=6105 RepID=A0A6P8HRR8_ACTTE|nr:vascular cell adhesion protein 1-like [Actinia tenebrosa]
MLCGRNSNPDPGSFRTWRIYKCTATNIFPGEAVAFDSLVVQDGTKIVKKPSPVIKEEGHTATFTCTASGSPTPKITWSKLFDSLPAGRYKVSQERAVKTHKINGAIIKTKLLSSNLTLMNLSTTNSGTYICEANNKLNNKKVIGQSTVLRALSFRVLPPSRIEARESDRVLIRC